MRIPRIYHPAALASSANIELEASAARHVARVLRLREGDELVLFDGHGGEYPAQIVELGKRSVSVACGALRDVDVESPLRVTLAQGVSKGDRMDYTIQKAVELGIARIVPLATSRSVVNLKGDRLEKKMAHWRGVIISACEQCGRNTLPELLPLAKLDSWLAKGSHDSGLLLDHRAEHSIATLPAPEQQACTLLIGPEGGLSETEREAAYAAGYRGLRLGPRVLRTETAALTALAALQSRFGDLL